MDQSPSLLSLIVRHELRVLMADRTLALVCTLLAAMIGYSLFVGLAQANLRDRMIVEVLEHQKQSKTSNAKLLRSVLAGEETRVPFSNPANPAAMAGRLAGRYATLPNRPLAPLAIGQSDMI